MPAATSASGVFEVPPTSKPFVWTAKLEDILEKIARARTKLESIQPGSTLPRRRQKREE
jgi:hypothetical protein